MLTQLKIRDNIITSYEVQEYIRKESIWQVGRLVYIQVSDPIYAPIKRQFYNIITQDTWVKLRQEYPSS